MITNEVTIQKDEKLSQKKSKKLFNKNFILLMQGQFVSNIGTQIFDVAMLLWIKSATGLASIMGLLLMASSIPDIILGPIGGTFADKHKRKKIIVLTDLLSGLAVLTIPLLMFIMPGSINIIIGLIFIVSIILGTLNSFFRPAVGASLPDLVPKKKLTQANSIRGLTVQGSVFAGQGIGGFLYSTVGAPISFMINGLSYLLSSASEKFIDIPQKLEKKKKLNFKEYMQDFIIELKKGFLYIWNNKGLRNFFLLVSVQNFFTAPVVVILPFHIENYLSLNPQWFGYMLATLGIGSLIGYIVTGMLNLSGERRAKMMYLALPIAFSQLIIMGVLLNPIISFTCVFLLGLMSGFLNININTIIQLSTPSHIRGRVMGVLGTLSMGLMPIGMGLGGIILDVIGQNAPLMLIWIGIFTGLLSLPILFNKSFRVLLSYEATEEENDDDDDDDDKNTNQDGLINES